MVVSMSSSICSFSGFVFAIFISPKYVLGWFWIAVGLDIGICYGSGDEGGEGSGGGGAWKFLWNELSDGGGGGIKLLKVGKYCGGIGAPLLLLSLDLLPSFCSASNLFCKSKSMRGLGAFLIILLARSFFPISSSQRKDPTTGFSASKVEMSSNTEL